MKKVGNGMEEVEEMKTGIEGEMVEGLITADEVRAKIEDMVEIEEESGSE